MNRSLISRISITLLVAGLLAACSKQVPDDRLELAIQRFHDNYNEKAWSRIYSSASPSLKKKMTESGFTNTMQELHKTLGIHLGSSLKTSSALANGLSVVVTASYDSNFEGGKATEHFIWRFKGEKAYLVLHVAFPKAEPPEIPPGPKTRPQRVPAVTQSQTAL